MATKKKAAAAVAADTVVVSLNYVGNITFNPVDNSGVPHRVVINGNAVHLKGKDMGVLPTGGAVGLTLVKRDLWEAVKAQYGEMAIFKNGLIFANDNHNDAADEAENRKSLRNGAEPVDPTKSTTTAAEG